MYEFVIHLKLGNIPLYIGFLTVLFSHKMNNSTIKETIIHIKLMINHIM